MQLYGFPKGRYNLSVSMLFIIVIVFIGDAMGASALAYAMGERGLLGDGEFFIIAVDVFNPYDQDKPTEKTIREF